MQTTGLTIQEAIKAVRDGQAKGCHNEYGTRHFVYLLDVQFNAHEVLDTWSLIDPIVTPSLGEVWRHKENAGIASECYILEGGKRIWDNGIKGNANQLQTYHKMIHGQNGWTRVYNPKEAKND